jgi:hypothetical protein
MTLEVAQSFRPPRRTSRRLAQGLGKGTARTRSPDAAEPPELNLERDRTALPGQVVEPTPITAMDALRWQPARRTRCGCSTRVGGDHDAVRCRHNLSNAQASRNEGQQTLGQGTIKGCGQGPCMCS